MVDTSSPWLPEGHVWDLHIERHSIASNLSFTGGGWKLVWHTTESDWNSYDTLVSYFTGAARGKAPHFMIGGRAGSTHPYVAQFVPLDESSFALAHPSGTEETNRANAIQVEICGRASWDSEWTDWRMKALANLYTLIDHRRDIINRSPQDFSNPHRMGEHEWVVAYGHVGHVMCPNNDHTDPGVHFPDGALRDFIRTVPNGGWDL